MDGMECGDVEWEKNVRPEPLCGGRRLRSKPISLRISIQSGGRGLFREWRSEAEKSGGMIGGVVLAQSELLPETRGRMIVAEEVV
ncbi:hypothetical protein KUCAC02_035349 [Chaenocephalus aceratus]|nr:hypothetical protein KUCAC02_035349 [Chaenocephalus aceratus]